MNGVINIPDTDMKPYNLNALTLHDSLEITRDMWNWLADNPGNSKEDYLEFAQLDELKTLASSCACCAYVKQLTEDASDGNCSMGNKRTKHCPIVSLWPSGCNKTGTPFDRWFNGVRESKYARQIANAAVLELIKLDEKEKESKAMDAQLGALLTGQKDPYAELKTAHKMGKVIQMNWASS